LIANLKPNYTGRYTQHTATTNQVEIKIVDYKVRIWKQILLVIREIVPCSGDT